MTVWLTEACGTFQNLLTLLSVTVMCITDRTGSKQTTKLAMTAATIYVVLYVLGLQLVSAVPSTVVYSTNGVLNGNRTYESTTQGAPSGNDSSSSETSITKPQETMTADSHDVHSSTTIGSGSSNGTSEDDTGNGTQATTPMSQETKEAPHTTPSKPQTTHPHGIRSTTASTSSSTTAGDGDVEKAPSESSFGSQCPLTPKDEPGTFTLDLKDIDLNCSNRTSLESLGEQPNENNNNTTTGGL
ncbi:hypothetical protein JZ751_006028 [Albula glossodonta]|uniref:Uncharacterized protein n=1 Tax=Albula glossodonta TaxID=121402 RepID=A0A8T2P757_9TELE|nr:hypothetical protein JZ751_006028 [Albula glossodonta]